jgi:hypothetical protein
MNFEDRMAELTMRLGEQMREARSLEEEIKGQLTTVVLLLDNV